MIDLTRTPMTLSELAQRLGISRETLSRRREALHARDGMPRPISNIGHPKFERASIEAWLTRHHPARGGRPANDVDITLVPASDAEWRARLADAYKVS